jgi:hypothetical protein
MSRRSSTATPAVRTEGLTKHFRTTVAVTHVLHREPAEGGTRGRLRHPAPTARARRADRPATWVGARVVGAPLGLGNAVGGAVAVVPVAVVPVAVVPVALLCLGAALAALGWVPQAVLPFGVLPAAGGYLLLVLADSFRWAAWVGGLAVRPPRGGPRRARGPGGRRRDARGGAAARRPRPGGLREKRPAELREHRAVPRCSSRERRPRAGRSPMT